MFRLTLSVSRGECKHAGCGNKARLFGVCREHEKQDIYRYFEHAVKTGACERETPPCFRSPEEWHEYVAAWVCANHNNFSGRARVDYCRDCNLKFKADMLAANRCGHPETVFIRSEKFGGDVIGVSVDHELRYTQAWETSVAGLAGDVVAMPDELDLTETLNKIQAKSAKKKRGPKPKKEAP